MTSEQKQAFDHDMRQLWTATKAAIRPEYHNRLRRVFMKMIKQDEREYREFVELMETTKEDLANRKLHEAADDQQENETDE